MEEKDQWSICFYTEDEALLRLKSLAIDQHFCYHMDNQCYKKYIFCLAETLAVFTEFKFSYANIDYVSISYMLVSI